MKKRKKSKKRISVSNKYTYGLLILFILLLIFLIIIYMNPSKKIKRGLDGELNTLKWESDGVEVSLGKEDGKVILYLNSNLEDLVQMRAAILEIQKSIWVLIDEMEANGAPVDKSQFNINFFEDDKLLKLSFGDEIADTILNGTVLFIEQSAEECGAEVVSDIIDKIEDSEVHDVNLSESNCGLTDIPGVIGAIDFATRYAAAIKTENIADTSIIGNKNAYSMIDFDEHFEYGDYCNFEVSSEGDGLRVEIYDDHFLDVFPTVEWVGTKEINVKLTCPGNILEDSFYLMVNDSSDSSGTNDLGDGSINNSTNKSNDGTGGDGDDDSNLAESDEYGSEGFRILNALPDKSSVAMSISDEETFSIDNLDYETIEWFVDGESIDEGFTAHDYEALEEGKYAIKVKITKAGKSVSNTWRAIVTKGDESAFSDGSGKKGVLYLIGAIVLIIAVIVGFLFFRKGGESSGGGNRGVGPGGRGGSGRNGRRRNGQGSSQGKPDYANMKVNYRR